MGSRMRNEVFLRSVDAVSSHSLNRLNVLGGSAPQFRRFDGCFFTSFLQSRRRPNSLGSMQIAHNTQRGSGALAEPTFFRVTDEVCEGSDAPCQSSKLCPSHG